jgi:hypothetical protein
MDPLRVHGVLQTSNFASRVPRFQENKKINQNLGPDRYVPEDNWIKETKKPPKPEFQKVHWQRAPNPPSIPSHDFIFGYEDTKAGNLKRQKNPEKIITGINNDRVGPGQYTIPDSFTKLNKGAVKWKNSKSKSFHNKKPAKKNQLGPGHYQVEKTEIFPVYKYKQSSVFASKVERATTVQVKKRSRASFPVGRTRPITSYQNMNSANKDHFAAELSSDDDDDLPGPGYYGSNENTSAFNPKHVPQRQQFFGSTVARFDSSQKGKSKVGPGTYNYDAPESAKTRASSQYQARRPPFSSSGNRFQNKKKINEPGPGSYTVADAIVQNENKRIIPIAKNRAFGTTERRFINSTSIETPGPGQYKPESNIKLLDKKKGGGNMKNSSSMFLSNVPRNPYNENKKKTKAPAVGSYEVGNYTIEENIRKKAGVGFENPLLANLKAKTKSNIPFSSNARRFEEKVEEADAWLAPGYYEHKAIFDENKSKGSKAKAQNFLVTSERFDKQKVNDTPGPGYYNKERSTAQWDKRSYNMIFTE